MLITIVLVGIVAIGLGTMVAMVAALFGRPIKWTQRK